MIYIKMNIIDIENKDKREVARKQRNRYLKGRKLERIGHGKRVEERKINIYYTIYISSDEQIKREKQLNLDI